MKNLATAMLLAASVIALSGCSKDKYEKEKTTALETGFTNEEVINVAKASLPSLRSDASYFGFSSSEFDQIQVGTPILVLYPTMDFRNDSTYDSFDKYLKNHKDWWVPLMVGNDIRSMMHVAWWEDSLKCVGAGGYGFIDDYVKKYKIQTENRYIIEDHSAYANCFYIMTKTGGNFTIYPIREYLPIQDWYPDCCKNLDKIYSSLKDLFYELKKEDFCFHVYGPGELD